MRPSPRQLALTFGGAALAAALLVVGPRLWIRTSQGHRTVERLLTRILNERVPGAVTVGTLGGSVLTGLRATELVVRNPDGAIIGQAPLIWARWRPLRLLRRRELEEVHVERPLVVLDRARWVVPVTKAPTASRDVFIRRISAHDGQARWKRLAFARLSGTATLHSSSHLDVHGVWAHQAGDALYASGRVGWAGTSPWVAARFSADRPGRLHGSGDVFYIRDRLRANLEELTVAAPLATRLVGGRGPLRVRGHANGSDRSIQLVGRAEQGARTAQLQLSIDRQRRSATFAASVDGMLRPIRASGLARYRPGTIVLDTLHATIGASRIDGHGTLARQRLHADLRMHVLPSEARLVQLQPAAPIDVELRADGPAHALALRGRARLEASQLSWRGRVDLPARSGALQLGARALQPARVVRGAPAMTVWGTVALAGRWAPRAFLGSVRLMGGTIDASGHRFSEVVADAPAARLGREGTLSFRQLSGTWKGRRVVARGVLRWNGREIAVSHAVADFAGAHAQVDARYELAGHRLVLRAAPLFLSRTLVSRLLGRPFPRPWRGSVVLAGRRGDVTIHAEAATIFGRLRAAAHLLRAGTYVDLRTVEAWLGDSHLLGAVHYRGGRIDASLQELVLSPSLVHQLRPQLNPAWPIRIHGALSGHQLLSLRAELDAGPSTARISGRIAARQFQLAVMLDNFDLMVLRPSEKRLRGTMQLAVHGQLAQGGIVGELAIRDAHGVLLESPFYRSVADARLEGRGFTLFRAVVRIPGARVMAKGTGALGKGGRIEYGVVITNAFAIRQVPPALRTLVGINSILPGRSVTGSITKQPGEPFAVSYQVLPIGLSQLEFLYRVLTGHYSWSKTPPPKGHH